ncbi:MAG: DNA polymerase III subunit gamma/tau, partial [Oscillospiraceae bacterium]|nr:DNA polymerase III subunit gamma/tau [Oscillospiraceae bacterium]
MWNMKLALYRKYRPKRFEEVVGQESVAFALRNQLREGKLGHAYLFTGVRGTGKTSLAKILAKAANCVNLTDGEPCCNCDICRGIDNGSILDVTEIDAASNNRVDDVRDILEEVSYMPAMCRMRVYIIDEVHMLSTAAFNALLKTLEEPPQHVLFILATTEIQKVPATILSRCQRFDLKRIPEDKISQRLQYVAQQESIELTDGAATLISRLADGALRDALSLLDTSASLGGTVDEETVQRLTGVTDKSYLFRLGDAIRDGNISLCMQLLQELYENGIDSTRLLNELVRHYRNLLMVRVGRVVLRDCSNEMQKRYELESGQYPEKELLNNLKILSESVDKMSRSLDREITLELSVLKLAEASGRLLSNSQTTEGVKKTLPKQVETISRDTQEPRETLAIDKNVDEQENSLAEPLDDIVENDFYDGWDKIIELVKQKQKTLGSLLSKSRAHFDGSHVLIEAGELAMKFIRENKESNQILKDAIYEITGERYPIGPWKK